MSTSSANKRFVFSDAGHCIAFGFGVGLTPRLPGTAGTLLAFPLYWLTFAVPLGVQFIIFLLLFALGVFLCGRASKALDKHDDSGIVLDEIVAFYGVLIFLPDWKSQLVAFVIFRLFDSLKPPPINWLDKNIPGGWGVMIDDIVAAVVTLVLMLLLNAMIQG